MEAQQVEPEILESRHRFLEALARPVPCSLELAYRLAATRHETASWRGFGRRLGDRAAQRLLSSPEPFRNRLEPFDDGGDFLKSPTDLPRQAVLQAASRQTERVRLGALVPGAAIPTPQRR